MSETKPLEARLREHVESIARSPLNISMPYWNAISNDILEAADRLASHLRAGAPSGWRDIASAPKDGRRVDLWVDYGGHGSARVPDARYRVSHDDDWEDSKPTWCTYRTDPQARHDQEWLALEHGTPTHWMPLPPPPITRTDGEI